MPVHVSCTLQPMQQRMFPPAACWLQSLRRPPPSACAGWPAGDRRRAGWTGGSGGARSHSPGAGAAPYTRAGSCTAVRQPTEGRVQSLQTHQCGRDKAPRYLHMRVWQPSKGSLGQTRTAGGGGQNLQNKSIRTLKWRDEAKNGNRYPVARLGNRHCGHYKARLKLVMIRESEYHF